MADDILLRIEDLSMNFGGLKAVDNLSFSIPQGRIVGLIGPNGAGKTTVFNCVTQFYKNYEGDILYKMEDGTERNLRETDVTDIVDIGIARTFQNIELVPDLSILDNVLIGAQKQVRTNIWSHILRLPSLHREEKDLREKALSVLDFLGLKTIKDFYVHGQPYGIKKKIEVARALMADPRLIVLDEPAAGLTASETANLRDLVRRIRAEYGITVLLIEHDMSFVMDICDSVIGINFGKFLAHDTPENIQNNPLVQEAYLGKGE